MRIIIVEDNKNKLGKIREVICRCDGEVEVEHCESSLDAKRLLEREEVVNLLILDLNIPREKNKEIKDGEGILLLEDILSLDRYSMPNRIIALTQYQDQLASFNNRFGTHDVTSIKYSPSELDWEEKLGSTITRLKKYLLQKSKSKKLFDYDLGIVVGLKLELAPYRELFENFVAINDLDDPAIFYQADFRVKDGSNLKVILGVGHEMGCTASSMLTTKMILKYRPRFLAMTGICGGVEGEVSIGDLVISDICFDYYFGKKTGPGFNDFLPDPRQCKLPRRVYKEVTYYTSSDFETSSLDTEKIKDVKVDTLVTASGSSVITDSEFLEHIKSTSQRKLSSIEMEIYGFYSSCENSSLMGIDYIALKSVCDLANSKKNDNYQIDCSNISARYLTGFVEYLHNKGFFT